MRIEDLDRARDAGVAAQQLADLAAIGIDWDGEPVIQSNRGEDHRRAIEHLSESGLVYTCTCSRRDILAAPTAPHAPPGAYPGTCRDLTDAQRRRAADRISPRLPALRLRAPAGLTELEFEDRVLGVTAGGIDDFVLRRGDGAVAYNLAVVVDDAAMGVDQVVRGDDLASSTPRQILLQQLLGLPTPEYAHVPLVLGPDGARLAKRDGAVTLAELASEGVDTAAVVGLLAASLGLAKPGARPSPESLLRGFVADQIPHDPWTLDPCELIPSA